jgi:hypothetical protein
MYLSGGPPGPSRLLSRGAIGGMNSEYDDHAQDMSGAGGGGGGAGGGTRDRDMHTHEMLAHLEQQQHQQLQQLQSAYGGASFYSTLYHT